MPESKRVAVVGSGIGGISAAWHLMQRGHTVDLYEAADRVGGHTWAVDIEGTMVDLGFMMSGDSNPNIRAWFASMGLTPKCRVPMSMSVVGEDWVFSSRKPFSGIGDVFNPKLWGLLRDIYKFTCDLLFSPPEPKGISTDDWCKKGRYGEWFYERYALPFFAILWTIPAAATRALPFSQFAACLRCHAQSLYLPPYQVVLGALGMRTSKPSMEWHVFGSSYLAPFLERFNNGQNRVLLNTPVASVARGGRSLTTAAGDTVEYDHVVLAAHAEESAEMIEGWAPDAAAVLRRHTFHASRMHVHRDPSFLPKDKGQWASWNVRVHEGEYVMTYYMNRIQHLPRTMGDVFVTITPKHDYSGPLPDPATYIMPAFDWGHPKLLADCVPETQLIDEPGVSLSGAWVGRGFHEDAFVAGRRAAAAVDDAAAARVPLYEDEANVPVDWKELPTTPFYVKMLPVVGAGAAAAAAWWWLR